MTLENPTCPHIPVEVILKLLTIKYSLKYLRFSTPIYCLDQKHAHNSPDFISIWYDNLATFFFNHKPCQENKGVFHMSGAYVYVNSHIQEKVLLSKSDQWLDLS